MLDLGRVWYGVRGLLCVGRCRRARLGIRRPRVCRLIFIGGHDQCDIIGRQSYA